METNTKIGASITDKTAILFLNGPLFWGRGFHIYWPSTERVTPIRPTFRQTEEVLGRQDIDMSPCHALICPREIPNCPCKYASICEPYEAREPQFLSV
jgi:hypothetical protein